MVASLTRTPCSAAHRVQCSANVVFGTGRRPRLQAAVGLGRDQASSSHPARGGDRAGLAALLLPAPNRPFRDAKGAGGLRRAARRPGRARSGRESRP